MRKIFLTEPGSLLYLVHNSRVVIPSPLYRTVSTFVFKVNLCCRVRTPVYLYRDVLRDVPPQIQTAHRHGQRRGLPGGPGGPALPPPRPGGAHLQPGQSPGRADGEVIFPRFQSVKLFPNLFLREKSESVRNIQPVVVGVSSTN